MPSDFEVKRRFSEPRVLCGRNGVNKYTAWQGGGQLLYINDQLLYINDQLLYINCGRTI